MSHSTSSRRAADASAPARAGVTRRWLRLAWIALAATLVGVAPRARAAETGETTAARERAAPVRLSAADRIEAAAIPAGSAAGLGAQAGAAAALPSQEYRISRGDELNLRFYYTPELNTAATVRPDGRISLPLVGEVQAEGMTVAELGETIERLLAPQVHRTQVAINVQGAASQRVFVGGEVGKPGMQPLVGPLTVLQAVMVAEGLRDTAQSNEVLVLRRGKNGQREVLKVDLDAAMSGRNLTGDFALQPFDAIVVPRTGIADVGRWVDQYIRRVLPISFGMSYTVDRNGVAR